MKILKYRVNSTILIGYFDIEMTKPVEILSFQMQAGYPTIWALCDDIVGMIKKKFYIIETGHEIDDQFQKRYIGTVQDQDVDWHLFEVIE